MNRIVIIDVARGSLAGLEKDIVRAGLKAQRISSSVEPADLIGGPKPLGLVVHYKRSDYLKKVLLPAGMAGQDSNHDFVEDHFGESFS